MADGNRWLDRAFALDRLHEDPMFRAVTAVAASPGRLLAPPATAALGLESVSAFLSDMHQLSDSESAASTKPVQSAAMAKIPARAKPKLSSKDRARRTKWQVQREIAQLERQIHCIRSAHFEKLVRIYNKRWKSTFVREARRTARSEAQQLRLLELVDKEQHRSKAVQEMIDRMRAFMPASLSRGPSQPQLDTDQDTAMLQMLVWTVNTKYRTLDHDLPTPAVTGEVSAGKLSADGAVAEYEFVRFLPFDKETISNVSWECAKCDFGSAYSEITEFCAADILAFKQEFVVPMRDLDDAKLKVLAVCKQFTSGDRTVVIWEGVCQWLTPTGGVTTTTHEQGSIVIESSAESADVSIAKGFMRLTPINSCSNRLSLVLNRTSTLTNVVLPSYQRVMDTRHQYVENILLDASRLMSNASPSLYSKPHGLATNIE